jgi:hypothetical protein
LALSYHWSCQRPSTNKPMFKTPQPISVGEESIRIGSIK